MRVTIVALGVVSVLLGGQGAALARPLCMTMQRGANGKLNGDVRPDLDPSSQCNQCLAKLSSRDQLRSLTRNDNKAVQVLIMEHDAEVDMSCQKLGTDSNSCTHVITNPVVGGVTAATFIDPARLDGCDYCDELTHELQHSRDWVESNEKHPLPRRVQGILGPEVCGGSGVKPTLEVEARAVRKQNVYRALFPSTACACPRVDYNSCNFKVAAKAGKTSDPVSDIPPMLRPAQWDACVPDIVVAVRGSITEVCRSLLPCETRLAEFKTVNGTWNESEMATRSGTSGGASNYGGVVGGAGGASVSVGVGVSWDMDVPTRIAGMGTVAEIQVWARPAGAGFSVSRHEEGEVSSRWADGYSCAHGFSFIDDTSLFWGPGGVNGRDGPCNVGYGIAAGPTELNQTVVVPAVGNLPDWVVAEAPSTGGESYGAIYSGAVRAYAGGQGEFSNGHFGATILGTGGVSIVPVQ